jgi:hypothetical protein
MVTTKAILFLPPFQLGLSVDCNLPYNASRFMSLAEMS